MAKVMVQTSFGNYRWIKFTLEPSPEFEKHEFDTSRAYKDLCGGKFLKKFKAEVRSYDGKYRGMIRAINKLGSVLTIYPSGNVIEIWIPVMGGYEKFRGRVLEILCREVFGKRARDVEISK